MQVEKAGAFEGVGDEGEVGWGAVSEGLVVEEGEEEVSGGGEGFSVVGWLGVG